MEKHLFEYIKDDSNLFRNYLKVHSKICLQKAMPIFADFKVEDYLLELATSPLSTAKRNFFSWYVSAPIVLCGRAFASSSVMP